MLVKFTETPLDGSADATCHQCTVKWFDHLQTRCQDGAPAHWAWETVQLLREQTPNFTGPEIWPPNSPDLNPVDYGIWGLLQ